MKKILLFLLLLTAQIMPAQQIEMLKIDSKAFGEKREVLVYLPESYALEPQRKFEVIYVFDAQSVQFFDIVHATLPFVSNSMPMIVVGVVCSSSEAKKQNRNSDFLPKPDYPQTVADYRGRVGNADTFLDFLESDVMTYIDANYRTLPARIGIGHSNGGTFLTHVLLKKPQLFDAMLLISPNLDYDKQQLVRRLSKLAPQQLTSQKYIFMCHANEGDGWPDANAKFETLMSQEPLKSKVHFKSMDFSKTENHATVFPIGLFHGLKDYIEWQFGNPENVIAYYNALEQQDIWKHSSEQINTMAYDFLNRSSATAALQIINWAIAKYPDDANLYDSRGEFFEKAGDRSSAAKSYADAVRVLELQKSKLDAKTYNEKHSYFKGNSDRLNK